MNYFKIDNEDFFLAKFLGKKKKITLLKWIEYQNDATFTYEDHVKIAKKRDQSQYPFEITSNRGHLLISREAFEQWEKKFEREEFNEKEIMEIDPEKVRMERYIRSIVDIKILDDLQSKIEYRRLEITPAFLSVVSTNQQPIQKKKRITPTLIQTTKKNE